MTDARDDAAPIGVAGLDGASAGAMLRAAREKRGLHIAALAASIKVTPRKLEALEADRFDELPDLTFTRALAQTVCRALKIDAEPVLARLPKAGDMPKLAQVGGGLNAPFRNAPGSRDPGAFSFHRRPVFWATLLVLAAALALAWLPERWMPWRGARTASVPAVRSAMLGSPIARPAAILPAAEAQPAIAGPATAPALPPPTADVSPSIDSGKSATSPSSTGIGSAAATAGLLALRTVADSWVEVQDAKGQMVLSRIVQPGETVGVDGALPLRVTIGNAAVTQVSFRGQPVDLASSTRDNVARLQLPR